LIRELDLEKQVKVFYQSALTFSPPEKSYYDYIFFGQSFMLINNQKEILDRVRGWLKPNGKVIFFQTMFKDKSKLMEFVKPKLKFLTTIDFGKVTYEKDFYELLSQKNFYSCEDKLLKKIFLKENTSLL